MTIPSTNRFACTTPCVRGVCGKSYGPNACKTCCERRLTCYGPATTTEHPPSTPPFTLGFRLHYGHGQILDGALFPSGRCLVVDDPEDGLVSAASSLDNLLRGYPDARIEWPPAHTQDGSAAV